MKRAITLKLNQQQLELFDRLVGAGIAEDRASLVVRALKELASINGYPGSRRGPTS
jgi:hypothetical protein